MTTRYYRGLLRRRTTALGASSTRTRTRDRAAVAAATSPSSSYAPLTMLSHAESVLVAKEPAILRAIQALRSGARGQKVRRDYELLLDSFITTYDLDVGSKAALLRQTISDVWKLYGGETKEARRSLPDGSPTESPPLSSARDRLDGITEADIRALRNAFGVATAGATSDGAILDEDDADTEPLVLPDEMRAVLRRYFGSSDLETAMASGEDLSGFFSSVKNLFKKKKKKEKSKKANLDAYSVAAEGYDVDVDDDDAAVSALEAHLAEVDPDYDLYATEARELAAYDYDAMLAELHGEYAELLARNIPLEGFFSRAKAAVRAFAAKKKKAKGDDDADASMGDPMTYEGSEWIADRIALERNIFKRMAEGVDKLKRKVRRGVRATPKASVMRSYPLPLGGRIDGVPALLRPLLEYEGGKYTDAEAFDDGQTRVSRVAVTLVTEDASKIVHHANAKAVTMRALAPRGGSGPLAAYAGGELRVLDMLGLKNHVSRNALLVAGNDTGGILDLTIAPESGGDADAKLSATLRVDLTGGPGRVWVTPPVVTAAQRYAPVIYLRFDAAGELDRIGVLEFPRTVAVAGQPIAASASDHSLAMESRKRKARTESAALLKKLSSGTGEAAPIAVSASSASRGDDSMEVEVVDTPEPSSSSSSSSPAVTHFAAVLRDAAKVPNLTVATLHAMANSTETRPESRPALGRANMAIARALRADLASPAGLGAPALVPHVSQKLRGELDGRVTQLMSTFDKALAALVDTDDDVATVAGEIAREIGGESNVAQLAESMSMLLHANAARLATPSDAEMRLGVLWRGANLERAVNVFKY